MAVDRTIDRVLKGLAAQAAKSTFGRESNGPSSGTVPSSRSEFPRRFRIRGTLGSGGMGVVYRAYDSELGHDVALKSLTRLEPDQVYHLKYEFRSLADIRHPNLVHLYELFVIEGGCFFTMELVTGSDFVSHIRQTADGKYERLYDAAQQLAMGISAVHAARKLHRDVKPSNVLVTKAGRVVLLDFGLVAPMQHDAEKTTGVGTLLGTVGYMAPEQARGEALTPAADWYSFGAALFEAATGRLPLDRPLPWLFGNPQAHGPARIRDHDASAPAELDELVRGLLEQAPERRPTGNDVLQVFARVPSIEASVPPQSLASVRRPPFEGREREMAVLTNALGRVKAGETITAHLHGPSGIGKTELARRFADEAERMGALVLSGRCHPLESVVFNAVDGMVDQLSQMLDRMSREDLAEVLPADTDALPRLFPVLGRIENIAEAQRAWAHDEQGFETLRRGTRALKELLSALGAKRPIVLWLDDVQWGDEDSGKLLRELVRPSAPTLLLVLTYRADGRESSRTLAALRTDEAKDTAAGVLDIPLGPLSEEETLSLVARMLGETDFAKSTELGKLTREAQGIPFFAHEIARFVTESSRSGADLPSRLRLSDMLDQRMLRLPEAARRVLEVVAVSGGPLEQRLVMHAAGLDESARPMLSDLERTCLVRSTSVSEGRPMEVYHHRIRDSVLGLLDAGARKDLHRAIADAMLTAPAPNLPQVVEHYDAANDVDAMRRYVVAAARQAALALAFDRAARLYARAVDVGQTELEPAELHERLGDALANAGRGRDAGRAFERAAVLGETAAAPADYGLSLRKRAAEQYLKSWQRGDAGRAVRTVAGPLGIAVPASAGAAIRDTLLNRARIAIKGFAGGASRGDVVVQPRLVHRLEVLQTLMQVYGMTEHTYSFAFGSRLLREALDVGDPHLLMRGLACECVAWAALDNGFSQRRADRHVEELERVCRAYGDDYDRAIIKQCLGIVHHFRGEFTRAVSALDAAAAGLRKVGTGVTVDVATNLSFRLAAMWFVGRIREQGKVLDAALADAEGRGDDYLVATCAAGHSSLAWLVSGRAEETARWAARVLDLAPPGFSSQHYLYLVTMVAMALYEGRGIDASERVEHNWQKIRDNHFLGLSNIGDDLRQTRARAAIAAARQLTDRGDDPERVASLLLVASKEADRVAKSSLPFGAGWADLLRAGISAVRGDPRGAARSLERGIDAMDECGMSFYAAAARYALSILREFPVERVDDLDVFWTESGVVDRRAAARMLVPGCVA